MEADDRFELPQTGIMSPVLYQTELIRNKIYLGVTYEIRTHAARITA